jgi:hypothetical protein
MAHEAENGTDCILIFPVKWGVFSENMTHKSEVNGAHTFWTCWKDCFAKPIGNQLCCLGKCCYHVCKLKQCLLLCITDPSINLNCWNAYGV